MSHGNVIIIVLVLSGMIAAMSIGVLLASLDRVRERRRAESRALRQAAEQQQQHDSPPIFRRMP